MVGGKGSGLADGSFEDALFFNPQGVTWRGDNVYVVDTDNHCIRQVISVEPCVCYDVQILTRSNHAKEHLILWI